MLKIRLARQGKKNYPVYRIVVSDHTKTPTSEALEVLGRYNPNTDPATLELKEDRAKHWLDNGVQYSDTVGDLLAKKGLIKKEQIKYTSKNPKKSKKSKDAAKKEA
ncbi:30S ribosomal protein S16, partial [Patescibacteria group bacterium]